MKDIRQVGEARRGTRLLGLFLIAAALGPSVRADRPSTVGPTAPFDASPARTRPVPSDFRALWMDLASLREAELSSRADELWEVEPQLTLRAMILRAGREVPATVTAARRGERLEQRDETLAWLRDRIDRDPEARVLWDNEVRERLADTGQTTLWRATVRTLGRLGETTLAAQLALQLDGDVQRAEAARLALFDLFLRWFDTTESFNEFWPEAQGTCGDSVFMQTAREKEREARESLVQLLKYEPQRAPDLLVSPDPRLRAAAAESLGRAQNGDATEALAALFAHLETEPNGEAFQAAVAALLKTQSASESNAPEVQRLRSILTARIREGAEDLQAPLADALRRLPWGTEPRSEDGLYVGVDALVNQVRRLIAPERLTDRDALVTCLAALQSLARRADEAGHAVDDRLAVIAPSLLERMEDPAEAVGVRIAAAQFLPLVGDTQALARAAAVLDADDTPAQLAYSLLGSIGPLAAELPPDDPAARLVLETLLARLTGDDANLRQRALAQLRSEELAPLVAQATPEAFVTALARESSADLQTQLLELIARCGGFAEARRLVQLENFDAIAMAGPATLSQLGDTLATLVGEDAALFVEAFERLLAVDDDGTRVLRLRDALGELASLPESSLAGLDAKAHHGIVRWATELRAASGSIPGGRELLTRLVTTHLPACGVGATPVEAAGLAHVRALLFADLYALDGGALVAADVVAAFAAAEQQAQATADDSLRGLVLRGLVLRDRARFQSARGDDVAALADYRALFELELELELAAVAQGTDESVLALGDLRRGSELLFRSAEEEGLAPAEAQRRVHEALRASLALVNDEVWRLEPDAVRLQDLRDVAARGLSAAEVPRVERAFAIFLGLPELPAEPEEGEEPTPTDFGPVPDQARWDGLLGERSVHAELLELRGQLRARIRRLSAPPQEPPVVPEDEVTPPESGDEPEDGPPEGPGDGEEPAGDEAGGENAFQKVALGVDSDGR